jgi:Mor family transcriptional regulator
MKLISVLSFLLLSLTSFSKVDVGTPSIKFIGYKFTDKTPVSGTFKKVEWKYKKVAADIEESLQGASFVIDSHSIDAGKVARNINITNALFKNWGGREIKGEVVKVLKSKKMVFTKFTVGERSFEVPFRYRMQSKKVILTAVIDLIDVGFKKSYELLSKRCAPWHKGKDGKTLTWSEVALEVSAIVK